MSKFKCSICNYTSPFKYNVKNHINKQTKCGEGIATIFEEKSEIQCEFCKKTLTTVQHLNRHNKICKVKKINLEKELLAKDEEVKKLKDELAIEKASRGTVNNIAQQNNLIINLTAYNDPNLKGMEKYYLTAIKKAFMSVPYIIEKIHFNINYPENQSMVIKNNRTKVAKVYDGEKWKSMDENSLIDEIINTYEQLLEDYAENDPERMEHIEKYRKIKERDSEETVLKDLKDEVKKLMYDNRNMVKIKS
jgi:hypothetical protein